MGWAGIGAENLTREDLYFERLIGTNYNIGLILFANDLARRNY